MTLAKLKRLGAQWQRTLRLEDWNVEFSFARKHQMPLKDRDIGGAATWCIGKKMAAIQVLAPIDYPETMVPQDQEVTLVHELLHLHLAPTEISEDRETEEEQAINAIAIALVALRRLNEEKEKKK